MLKIVTSIIGISVIFTYTTHTLCRVHVGDGSSETGEVTTDPERLLEIHQEQQDVSAPNNCTDV